MNTISWFEIPAKDIDRAQKFYEEIMDISMVNLDNEGLKMRVFPVPDLRTDISGAVVYNEQFYSPAEHKGVLVYLNAGENLQTVLEKVDNAGGSIILRKTQISEEFGYMALIMDTEGNRIGLHSPQ